MFLCLLTLCDVHICSVDADGLAQLITNDSGAAEDHMDAAIRPHHAILNVARTSLGEKLHAALHHIFAVVRMHSFSVILEVRTLAVVIAEKEAQVLLRVEVFARYQILFPTTGVAQGFRLPQNLLALSNCFLRALPIVNVDRHAIPLDNFPRLITQWVGAKDRKSTRLNSSH